MKEQPYHEIDHAHCWESKKPPCGQMIKHFKCCLCEMVHPEIQRLQPHKDTHEK